MRRARSVFGFIVLAGMSSTALAQGVVHSAIGGVTVGGTLHAATVTERYGGKDEKDFGRGLAADVGWAVNPRYTLFAAAGISSLNSSAIDYQIRQFDAGLRYMFRNGARKARPYAEGALVFRTLNRDVQSGSRIVDVEAKSRGYGLAIGTQIFVRPRIAVDLALAHAPGRFKRWTLDGTASNREPADAGSTLIRAGLRYWPMGK